MPLEKIVSGNDRAWALWRITEDEDTLSNALEGIERISDTITHPNKRLEWLAGRSLLTEVFASLGLRYQGITKDEHGKPSPLSCHYQLSLTHSFPFVATLVDKYGPVGIDLEQPKVKLFRVAHRVFDRDELRDAGNDLIKHCVYWCAKESLVKVHGRKDLIFAENLRIDPFQLGESGDIRGRIVSGRSETFIPLHYTVYPGFVLVFNQRNNL